MMGVRKTGALVYVLEYVSTISTVYDHTTTLDSSVFYDILSYICQLVTL